MSLKDKIFQYLKDQSPRIVHKGEIGKLAVLEWGYENENAGRRCRELATAGLIKRIENEKGEVMYQYLAPEKKKEELVGLPLSYPQLHKSTSIWTEY